MFLGPQQLHTLPFSVHIAVGIYIQRRGYRRMTKYFGKTSVINSFLNSQSSEAVAERMKIQIGKLAFLQALAISLLNCARFHAFSGPGQYKTVGILRLRAQQLS